MLPEELNNLKSAIKSTIDDVNFFSEIFSYVTKERKIGQKLESDNLKRVCCEEYEKLSERLDNISIQDSCSVRNNLRTRRIANLLIDDKGILNILSLNHLIKILKKHLYFLGPERHHDSKRQEQILSALELLSKDKEYVRVLQSISRPYMNPLADQIIRDTLQLPEKTTITDAHARKAVLSGWMCYLRQVLGSCFATAPAIIVHDEQPIKFFEDMIELFGTGSLKRTFGGIEYSVPFNGSSGSGDLKKPFYISGKLSEELTSLCSQPGIIEAFEKEEIIHSENPFSANVNILKEYALKFLEKSQNSNTPFFINSEELIKYILLSYYSLSEKDIQESENKIINEFRLGAILQIPAAKTSNQNRSDVISKFKISFNRAKRTYKSLSDNALLRSWEYTIASFAETKGEFSKWNLYSSLGFKHTEPGGIGACLYVILKTKLDQFNRESEEYQFQYEQMFSLVKILENRLKRASSEEEERWLKIDYRAKVAELDNIIEFRNRAHSNAQRMANLYDVLINHYIKLFPEYFQEIYDPEMMDVNAGPYDDSPAGFRLVYKHGRTNSAQWTTITRHEQFIDFLVNFFIAAERRMEVEDEFKGLDTVLSEITTEIVTHIRTKEFLETALERMAIAHNTKLIKNPLENLDKVEKKPWVYTSGGNFHTLVSVYFKRDHKPTSVSRWVENTQELLIFLVDTVKQLPQNILNEYASNPKKSMLMYSPTHAFILKPGEKPFCDAWKSTNYSYTWVRDNLIFPLERFNESIVLTSDSVQYLVKRLLQYIPINFRPYFYDSFGRTNASMSMQMFRDYLIYGMQSNKGLQIRGNNILSESMIDRELYRNAPIFPMKEMKDRLQNVLSKLPNISKKEIDTILMLQEEFTAKFFGESVMGSLHFQNVCKALICLVKKRTSFPEDYALLIKRICTEEGYCMPHPIVFADTNWVKNDFAFLVNPGTGKFELWRVDSIGSDVEPMSSWNLWLDGTHKTPDWGVFIRPHEYIK